ncbi:Imm49 family immunity protein [Hyalangium versicolor]|uniref:Imm49 family immunity protein n=1 Tax=Hyalangium versicolor TaxID=2861190 RepID=UPI001CCEB3D5|nr:Imm49 family immunity protein [Hyalangium versicolor]
MDDFRTSADRDTLLAQVQDIVHCLHLIGVATLLVDGNPQGFFLNLCRAAENGRRLLALLHSRQLTPPPASWNMPLLAALAAGNFPQADAIVSVSTTTWQHVEVREYEDEFLWAVILQSLARAKPAPASTLEPLIARLEKVSKKEYGSRCALARAMLAQDADAFAQAFSATRLDYEIQTEKAAKEFGTPVTPFAPHRFLWLEGLALLRLAERAGLVLEDADYRYCPPLARVPMTARYADDWAIPASSSA